MSDHNNFQPTTKEEALAQELAERLGDPEGLPFYLKVAREYSESHIRRIVGLVLEVPLDRIHKSRGAFFNWLIQYHGKKPRKKNSAPNARD